MNVEKVIFTSEEIYLISARDLVERYPQKVAICKETGRRYVRHAHRGRTYFNINGDKYCQYGRTQRHKQENKDYREWEIKDTDDCLRIKVINKDGAFEVFGVFLKKHVMADIGTNLVRGSIRQVGDDYFLYKDCNHLDIGKA